MSTEIVEYRAGWTQEFQDLGSRLRDALETVALRIDHIGSTAVPGLAAKDVLDLQITVNDLENARLRSSLEGLGLKWWEDLRHDHCPPGNLLNLKQLEKRYAQARAPHRVARLHIRVKGRFNTRYALLCRDYLRTYSSAAQAYGEVKKQLARYFPENKQAYCDVKDPVFDIIMAGAEEWATLTAWQPGPSDA